MSHPLSNSNGSAGYRSFAPTSKGRGYLPFDIVTGRNAIGGGFETTGTAQQTGGNGDDKWERFFGTPPYTTWQRDNYSDLGHENYQLPTAYIGRNLHIEKLLNVSIASQDDFYTRVLLPWKVYDGMKITFSKWSGFDHMMYQIPEEVPAPQIQTKFESGEAYQQRYGLAFKMEHGFQRTEMGRQAYTMNLQIITQAVLRTVYSRIMQVLVHNQNWLQVLANRYYPSRMALAREISKTSVNSFGCMQKETFGLQIVMNSVQKLFEARQLAPPDSIVLPHGCMAYMSLAKPENRIYALCGALAQKLNLDPKRELAVNVFGNNLQVFEHRPMNVSDSPHEVSILTRNRDVGNVWRLFRDPHSENGGQLREETAIRVIDHDKQRWATLTMSDALQRCGVWNTNHQINRSPWDRAGPANTQVPNEHITGNRFKTTNPLFNKHVFGDLISIIGTKYKDAATRRVDGITADPDTVVGWLARSFTAGGAANPIQFDVANALGRAVPGAIPVNVPETPEMGNVAIDPATHEEYVARYRGAVQALLSDATVAQYYENPYDGAVDDLDADMPIQLTTNTIKKSIDVIIARLRSMNAAATEACENHMETVAAGNNMTNGFFAGVPAVVAPAAPAAAVPARPDVVTPVFNLLRALMPNNLIETNDEWMAHPARGPNLGAQMMGNNPNVQPTRGTTVAAAPIGASMDDLVTTLQESVASQIGGFDGTEDDFSAIAAGINDILGRASDWSDEKRYTVGKAIEAHAPEFTKSIAKLTALKNSTDSSAKKALAKDYIKALGSDFKSKWSKINATQKEIGKQEAVKAAPIGVGLQQVDDDAGLRSAIYDYENLMQLQQIMGWVYTRSGYSRLQKEVAKYWLMNFTDSNSVISMDRKGIPTPFGALVFRPFQSFNMGSAIVMKSGEQTGFTAVGNSDFQLGDNVTNKTHLGHFTFYFEPVVHEPNHIMIARDVVFMGYHGGAGMGWFADSSNGGPYALHQTDPDGGWSSIVTKIQAAHIVRPSLLSALAFAHEAEDRYFMDPMSIHGTFDRSSILNDLQEAGLPHYAASTYYKSMLDPEVTNGLDESTSAATGGMFHNSNSSGVCYQGLQCSKTLDGKWDDFTANTGHLGKAESLDSSLVWSGQIATKTSVNYEKAGNSVSLFNKYT